MKEKVLEIIKMMNGKANFKILKAKTELGDKALNNLLLELKLDGLVLQTSNRYSVFPEGMLMGEISVTSNGNKVIFYNGKKIPLMSNFFNKVLLDDIVSFVINDDGMAEVTSIIDRRLRDVTCKVVVDGKKKRIECFHSGFNITLSKEVMDNLLDGDIILVKVGINDEDCGYCPCEFKKVIGHINDPNIDEIQIAINYGFDTDYSEAYLEELKLVPRFVTEEECTLRTDFRRIDFLTIDGIYAKDMDDAVYAEKTIDGYRLYVSISDVSHYVKFGTEIFKRAYEKGNSFYSNNSVFHMLHHIISNGICSLNPDEDRLTKTVIMDIDKFGDVKDSKIVKSVIRSRKKMNYDDVDKILTLGEVPIGYEPYVETLKILHEITTLLERKAKEINGKVDFPSEELEKEYDEDNNIVAIKDMDDSPARKLIEHAMIAANVCVAEFVFWSCIPSVYRTHETPNLLKVNDAIKKINENGFKLKSLDNVDNPKVIQTILNKLSSCNEYPILSSLLLRSMQRAEYSPDNTGHYALGEEIYTHFTSPIRRLCDLLVHMILDLIIDDYDLIEHIDFDKMEVFLENACKQASRMERRADAAEKVTERLALIKSMQKDVGSECDAVVLDIGNQVKIKVNGVSTYVRCKDMLGVFSYDGGSKSYYDKTTNQPLKLGSKIKVLLTGVNLTNRTISVAVLGIIDSKVLKKKI